MTAALRVLFVTSEVYPLVKTGGLADVSAALPEALIKLGVDVRLLVPGYPAILDGMANLRTVRKLSDVMGATDARLMQGTLPSGVPAFVIASPTLYDRPGNPYLNAQGKDWPDNHLRFAALGWVAADLGEGAYGSVWRPDIIHGHDWQAGLAPAYMAIEGGPRPATVMTIHNIAYQGLFPRKVLNDVGLPQDSFGIDGVEYYGQLGFLKAGLYYADRLTTVSPTYAQEIQGPEQGCGLEGLLRARAGDLTGILNGIDLETWNPATDPHLRATYTAETLSQKALNRDALLAEFGLAPAADAPVFAVISRLSPQKGLDLLLEAAPSILQRGTRLVILGSGDRNLEDGFRALASDWPTQVAVRIGYDETLSHRIQGGADVVVIPSRSEPCGLVQMYGLRYGTLPLVRRTGGLADTVVNATPSSLHDNIATGFVFDESWSGALAGTLNNAMDIFAQPQQWQQMQKTAMAQDFGWEASAKQYLVLYQELVSQA